MYSVFNSKIEKWCEEYKGEKSHAIFCDPPYEIGMMGKNWDGTGVTFRPETWRMLSEHLHDGAFIIAFSGSRTWHRQAVAMEDAGLIMHSSLFGWTFACLSDDTEILTNDGWKLRSEINDNHYVLQFNKETEVLSYVKPEHKFEYEYDGAAYSLKSEHTDQIVTPTHRCLVERNGKWEFEFAERLTMEERVPILEDLPDMQYSFFCDEQRPILPKKSLQSSMCNEIFFNEEAWKKVQAKESKKTKAENSKSYLSDLCQRILYPCGLVEEDKRHSMLRDGVQERSISKRQGSGCINEENRQQRPRVLDRRKPQKLFGENVWRKKSSMEGRSNLFQKERKLQRCEICEMPEGIYFNVTKRWICDGAPLDCGEANRSVLVENGSCSPHRSRSIEQLSRKSDAICYKSGTQIIRTIRVSSSNVEVRPIHYTGIVWCVKVPSGAFVARRNGKIFITGNSGFPKATRVRTGEETDKTYVRNKKESFGDQKIWEGHRYGLQAIKPALEPILIFQKPYKGKPVENIVSTGAGALNIDAARIGSETISAHGGGVNKEGRIYGGGIGIPSIQKGTNEHIGRWPANLMLCHHPDCKPLGNKKVKGSSCRPEDIGKGREGDFSNGIYGAKSSKITTAYTDSEGFETVQAWDCVECCPVRRMDAQSGITKSGKVTNEKEAYDSESNTNFLKGQTTFENQHGDEGGASRFFFNADFMLDKLEDSDPVIYAAKASASERNMGCRSLDGNDDKYNNHHPCVKPLSLVKYLATLLLPPDSYAPRRLLVPFSGSGSEMCGALLSGWDEIIGIEGEKEYCDIAELRLKYWASIGIQSTLNL